LFPEEKKKKHFKFKMGLKGFVEGGIASIVAGCATHPLDLLKVRMQLQGENQGPIPKPAVQTLRPALAFHATSLSAPGSIHVPLQQPQAARAGLLAVGVRLVQQEGVAALFSVISATVLSQAMYSTTRMGL